MATLKQRRLAQGIIENLQSAGAPKSVTSIMEQAGYAPTTAAHEQKRELERVGTQQELKRHGFDLAETDGVVRAILQKTKRDETKLKAADLIYKRVPDGYAAQKQLNVNVDVKTEINAETKLLMDEFEAKLKLQQI